MFEERGWSILTSYISNDDRDIVCIIYRRYTRGYIMVLKSVKAISTHLLLKKSVDWEPTIFNNLDLLWRVHGGRLRFWLAVGSLRYMNPRDDSFEFETLQ